MTAAWNSQFPQKREWFRERTFGARLYMIFTRRATNHHKEGHSRNLQTLSYVFSMSKAI